VLTESFDEPSINCIAIGRLTKSQSLYSQMVGRGTRMWPEKATAWCSTRSVWSKEHELCSIASLLGRSLPRSA
jgi:superfamily II DNA or RNA helicase